MAVEYNDGMNRDNQQDAKLEFVSLQKEDFVRAALTVHFRPGDRRVTQISINHAGFGLMEMTPDSREIHRWEDEDEAQDVSYLSRRFTAVLIDGVVTDPAFERDLLTAVEREIANSADCADRELFLDLLQQVGRGEFPEHLPPAPSEALLGQYVI